MQNSDSFYSSVCFVSMRATHTQWFVVDSGAFASNDVYKKEFFMPAVTISSNVYRRWTYQLGHRAWILLLKKPICLHRPRVKCRHLKTNDRQIHFSLSYMAESKRKTIPLSSNCDIRHLFPPLQCIPLIQLGGALPIWKREKQQATSIVLQAWDNKRGITGQWSYRNWKNTLRFSG